MSIPPSSNWSASRPRTTFIRNRERCVPFPLFFFLFPPPLFLRSLVRFRLICSLEMETIRFSILDRERGAFLSKVVLSVKRKRDVFDQWVNSRSNSPFHFSFSFVDKWIHRRVLFGVLVECNASSSQFRIEIASLYRKENCFPRTSLWRVSSFLLVLSLCASERT